jgi:hypothetical protein
MIPLFLFIENYDTNVVNIFYYTKKDIKKANFFFEVLLTCPTHGVSRIRILFQKIFVQFFGSITNRMGKFSKDRSGDKVLSPPSTPEVLPV